MQLPPQEVDVLLKSIKKCLGSNLHLAERFTGLHIKMLLDQKIYDEGDLKRVSAKDLRDCGLPIGLVALLKPVKSELLAVG